ncbi:MAG: DUF4197 domain-containing protein [Gammaproteobacteria bacterium]|nr:DUF4197 domain-containing protein [Gammaproteobacteria bacterium]
MPHTRIPALIFILLPGLALSACTKEDLLRGAGQVAEQIGSNQGLTQADIEAGLREALKVGTGRVSDELGAVDAFQDDPLIHIPLPAQLREVDEALSKIGLGRYGDELELKLNRAAERAAPAARDVFWSAIRQMSLRDVMDIYNGPDDAATQYFKQAMTAELAERMRPIIDEAMLEVGAIRTYDETMQKYDALPFLPDVKADLTEHVVDGALGGLFHYLAEEEAAIRNDPAARTTELLRRVFGR